MNRITPRAASWGGSVAVALAVAGLMAGCSSSRPNSNLSPRTQAPDAVSRDLASLRQENDALKQEQLDNTRKIEALQKQLVAEKEEQKRFRQMMSTNFDLLEQSVALTLSKSIENGNGPKAPLVAQATPPAGKSAAAKTPMAPPAPVAAPATDRTPPTERMAPEEAKDGHPHAAPKEAQEPKTIGQSGKSALPMTAAMGAGTGRSSAKGSEPFVVAAVPAGQMASARSIPPAAAPAEPEFKDADLTPPAKPKTLTANRAAKALYERGFALYANRQYDQAILVYQNFLSRYPEDIYSDNAQFWIGESYLHLDKLADAETAYRKVLREYDHKTSLEGYKTPEAIYRLGTLSSKRNQPARARYYFTAVAQRFPDSSAGRKAQRELEGKPQTTAQSEADEDKAGG